MIVQTVTCVLSALRETMICRSIVCGPIVFFPYTTSLRPQPLTRGARFGMLQF
jgi:hypothetical protein